MPKLLSQEEVNGIAAKMTAAYGLPPPLIAEDAYHGSASWNVSVQIFRTLKVQHKSKWFNIKRTRVIRVKVRDFYANDYEDALTKLESELNKLNARTNVAEHFREKFALQEADEVLDDILQQPPVPIL